MHVTLAHMCSHIHVHESLSAVSCNINQNYETQPVSPLQFWPGIGIILLKLRLAGTPVSAGLQRGSYSIGCSYVCLPAGERGSHAIR